MEKNEEYIGVVSAVGSNYEGLVKIDGYVCIIPLALEKEKVRFKVLKVQKNIAYCKLLEVLAPSQSRVRPECPIFEKCGGCSLQHISYKKQLRFKTSNIERTFKKVAFLDVKALSTFGSVYQFYYRNKLQMPIRDTSNGPQIGFFAEHSHRLVPVKSCAIQEKWNKDLIDILYSFIYKYDISCYSDETKKGLLKHLVVRSIGISLIIVLVINGSFLPHSSELITMIGEKFNNFSFYLNRNETDTNVIFGNDFSLLHGPGQYSIEEFGIKYKVGPQSFIQVNNHIKFRLYKEVLKIMEPDQNMVVIDAYSGIGLLTALFSKECKKAIGIEIVQEAVDAANQLLIDNFMVGNVENYCGDCAELLPEILVRERDADTKVGLILDPPRKGCEFNILDAIKEQKPDKVLYISCNCQTLARDIGYLMGSLKFEEKNLIKNDDFSIENADYSINYVRGFDMFAQTKHVETIVSLTLKKQK